MLILEIESFEGSSVWQSLAAHFINQTGTPLLSCDPNDSGEAIAGVFTGTLSDVTPGVSGTVTIQTSSPDNPYRTSVDHPAIDVDLDGASVYRNIVGGVDLVFDEDAAEDDVFQIRVGFSFGALAGFGSAAGQPSASRKIRIRNDDTDDPEAADALNVKASIARRAKVFTTTGVVFARAFEFAPSAVEKITGGSIQPYAITIDNTAGSGSGKTADLLVEGDPVTMQNVTTPASGTSEGLNVTDVYRIADGDLQDFEFQLSEDANDSATANVLIFNARFTQIAPDLGGSPGDFGTSDVFFTADGEAVGSLPIGSVAYAHVRALVPEGSVSQSNPYVMDVMISAESTSGNNWSG